MFRLGLEQAGFLCVGHCEIDRFANISYNAMHQLDNQPNNRGEWFASDITKIDPTSVPKADIWTAGFPCQDLSTSKGAGRQGLHGARSGLFFEFTKLLEAQPDENKPRWVILENVKGLFSANGGWDFATVLYQMAEMGYRVEYALLNSKDYGVPQNRERVYAVGYFGELDEPFSPLHEHDMTMPLSAILETDVDEKYFIAPDREATIMSKLYEEILGRDVLSMNIYPHDLPLCGNNASNYSNSNNDDSNNDNGGNDEEVRLKQLLGGQQGNRVYCSTGLSCTLTSGGGGSGAKTGLYLVNNPNDISSNKYNDKHNQYLVNARNKNKGHKLRVRNIANCIDATYFKGIQSNQDRTGVLHTSLPKALLTPNRINKRQNGRRVKDDNEPMFTLTAQDVHGILQNSRIRRLTPRECFRLQGVSDEYFDRIINNAKCHRGKPVSDSQLYKQAGNAVTVSVVRAIAERIAEIEMKMS